MPLPELKSDACHFYAVGGKQEPTEVVLDYYEPDTGRAGLARTYWHPAVRSLGGIAWEPIPNAEGARSFMVDLRGDAAAEDEMASLLHRVRLQLGHP